MSDNRLNSATDVAEKVMMSVPVVTASAGLMTIFDLMAKALGCVASAVGIYVSLAIYKQRTEMFALRKKEIKGEDNGIS